MKNRHTRIKRLSNDSENLIKTVQILSTKLFNDGKGCVFDAKMYFTDNNNELYRYHIEIKSRRQNMEEYDTLPLTVQSIAT